MQPLVHHIMDVLLHHWSSFIVNGALQDLCMYVLCTVWPQLLAGCCSG